MMDCIQYEIDTYSSFDNIKCSQGVEACDGAYLGLLSHSFKKLDSNAEDFELRTLTDLQNKLKAMKFPAIALDISGNGCCQNPTQNPGCLSAASSHNCASCQTCSSCSNRFKPQFGSAEDNHEKCSPLTRLHKRLDEIINSISGLEYSRYVRRQGPKDIPDLNDDNLWDCLHYS